MLKKEKIKELKKLYITTLKKVYLYRLHLIFETSTNITKELKSLKKEFKLDLEKNLSDLDLKLSLEENKNIKYFLKNLENY